MSSKNCEAFPQTGHLRRDEMKTPDDVTAMVRLKRLGWGSKRIAAELGCARNTVRRWLQQGQRRAGRIVSAHQARRGRTCLVDG